MLDSRYSLIEVLLQFYFFTIKIRKKKLTMKFFNNKIRFVKKFHCKTCRIVKKILEIFQKIANRINYGRINYGTVYYVVAIKIIVNKLFSIATACKVFLSIQHG